MNPQNREKEDLFKETLALVRLIYQKYPVGGFLHVVLDDGNIGNEVIRGCIEDVLRDDDTEDRDLFLNCSNNLLKMTISQKKKILRSSYHD